MATISCDSASAISDGAISNRNSVPSQMYPASFSRDVNYIQTADFLALIDVSMSLLSFLLEPFLRYLL